MTFNKWFPERPDVASRGPGPVGRARLLRAAWWASTLMLVLGYVLVFLQWDA